ncbi:MAG: GNAT family N-acetyltransferase [Anaerolineae bacterium]|nr:GNAT family N-acetyltransferase [Anaerolineae bacterium]
MIVHNRPFNIAQNDFEKMWRFLQQDYAQKQDGFIWLFSRLGDWKYGLWNEKKLVPSFFRKHAQLWVDGFDRLLGFVLSEDGENIFFIFTLCGYEYLYADILDWTIRHWRPRYAMLKTEVHEGQSEALAQLERNGFCSAGMVAITREYDLPAKKHEAIRLKPDFQIVDMQENTDYRSKGLLYKNAFENQDQVSEFDLLRFEYSRENPAYDPQFDLSVVTSEGVHVASCVGFNDPAYRVAEVEKICTHRDYRRQGLAEAVTRECFHRLSKRGIERAYITGYSTEANGLYEKLGPCKYKKWFHYELDASI